MTAVPDFLPERVADFHGQNRRATLVNAGLLVLALWALAGRVPTQTLTGWTVAVLASHALRLSSTALRRTDPQADVHALRWAWAATAALGSTGLAWGGGAWVMLDANDPTAEVFWTIALCGIAAGVVAGAPYFVPAQWAYLLPLLLPLVLHYGLQPGAVSRAVAGGLALFLVFCLAQGRAQARSLRDSMAIRAQNAQLLADLQARTQDALAAQRLAEDAAQADAPPAEQARLRRQTSEGIAALDRLFEGILAVARLEAGVEVGALQPVPLAPLAWRQAASATAVQADPAALERLLANLLANALQHTPQGRVLLALRHGNDGTVRLQVRDSGVGIAQAEQIRVFDEFHQAGPPEARRHDGNGLGLAVARRLAQAMGGQITLRSAPGRGSCFTLRLPAATMARQNNHPKDSP